MAGIFSRTLTGAAIAVLAGGAAAVGVTTVASAHTPEVSATCTQLQVHLANYPAKSTVDVVLDGHDEGTDTFGPSTYERTFPLDGTVAHEWSVTLVSGDGNTDFDRTITGKSDGSCLASTPPSTTPPATTPPATTPPTTPPATTTPTPTPTTPPVSTPPATTTPTPTPTDTPSTPSTPVATTVPVPPPSDTPTAGTPTTGTPVTNTPGATTVPVPSPSDSTTPAAVTGPNGGSGSTGSGSATTGTTGTGSTASDDQLAYTGSTVGLGVGVGALTTILVGGALTAIAAVRRRRQARI